MSSTRSTWLVAIRESSERARSRSYIISTVLTLVIVGVLVGATVLTSRQTPAYDVGVTGDNPPSLAAAIAATATASDALVSVIQYPDEASVRSAVDDGTIAAAVIDDDVIVVRQSGGSGVEPIIEAALRQARLFTALTEAGVDPATLIDNVSIAIEATEPPDDDGDEAVAFIAIVLLFLVITTYGQWVLLGVLEEKSTRVVEQLVSSTSVRSLLAGKVIGVGLLGFAQLAVFIVAGVAVGSAFDAFELPSATYATAAWAVVWFVLGFAFYAVMYAAAGSLVSRSEDAQAAATPVVLLGIGAYLVTMFLVLPTQVSPAVSRIISMLPPVAPFAFPARIAAGAVPLWEILLAVVMTLAAVVAVVRVAARIYAGALLAQGSRIKLRQAWRASRELAGR